MNILVCDYKRTGENVMVFTENDNAFTPVQLAMALVGKGIDFEELYPVQDHELQYYIYEPLWADDNFIKGVHKAEEGLRCCAACGSERANQMWKEARRKAGEAA